MRTWAHLHSALPQLSQSICVSEDSLMHIQAPLRTDLPQPSLSISLSKYPMMRTWALTQPALLQLSLYPCLPKYSLIQTWAHLHQALLQPSRPWASTHPHSKVSSIVQGCYCAHPYRSYPWHQSCVSLLTQVCFCAPPSYISPYLLKLSYKGGSCLDDWEMSFWGDDILYRDACVVV